MNFYQQICHWLQQIGLRLSFWPHSLWARIVREEKGANMVLVALSMTVMIGMAGIAIDGSNLYFQQQRMQIAADAAALGGARQLAMNAGFDEVDGEIETLATENYATAVDWQLINNDRGVQVTAMREFDAYFAQIYGYDTFSVTASAEAQFEPVTGTDGLFPLTLDCDCVDEADVIPVAGPGEEDDGDTAPTPTPTPTTPDDGFPTEGTVVLDEGQNSAYNIRFISQVENTWTYEVAESNGKDLSHWLLDIGTCLSNVVSSNPSGAEIGVDSSTGVSGIKWNTNEVFISGQFAFTLDADYPAGAVEALAKAGTDFGTAVVRGPVCDGTNLGSGTPPTDNTGIANLCLPTIDFEIDSAGASMVAGQKIDTEWGAWGVRVATNGGSSHPAMIFDTAGPTGNDPDLGAPNQDFGGPGVGEGGRLNRPGQNGTPLGKVLMIGETSNSALPDDNANGGKIFFNFDFPVRMDEVQILDIDDVNAAGTVKAYSDTGGTTLVATGNMLGLGNNSIQRIGLNGRNVRRLEINFPASGGVASIISCRNQALTQYRVGSLIWSDDDADGLQDNGEAGIPGVALDLYISGQSSVVASTVTNATGDYLFANLPAGNYEVQVANSNFATGGSLAGALYSPVVNSNAATNSDCNSATGRATASLTSADDMNVDCGFSVPPEIVPGPTSTTIELNDNKNSAYEITFISVINNTWKYRVREVAGRDLSHWNLGIVNCMNKVVTNSPTPGGATIGTDGTGFAGIKWDVAGSFRDGYFTFTLDDNYAIGTVQAQAKAGTAYQDLPIAGPNCDALSTDDGSTTTPDPGDDDGGNTPDPDEPNACTFGWLDWDGGDSTTSELNVSMEELDSGTLRVGEVIPPGPPIEDADAWVQQGLDARVGESIKIPLTEYNGTGYAICGFANVKLLEHDIDEGQLWLQFLRDIIRGTETDPNADDYGARDVIFLD